MVLDVSWSLGEDYEQDYEELSANTTKMQIVKGGPIASGSNMSFKGESVSEWIFLIHLLIHFWTII